MDRNVMTAPFARLPKHDCTYDCPKYNCVIHRLSTCRARLDKLQHSRSSCLFYPTPDKLLLRNRTPGPKAKTFVCYSRTRVVYTQAWIRPRPPT
jgi:hypothetical protein